MENTASHPSRHLRLLPLRLLLLLLFCMQTLTPSPFPKPSLLLHRLRSVPSTDRNARRPPPSSPVAQPFLHFLADLGTVPDKPHKKIARMLKGKTFRRPDISVTIQDYLASKGAAVGDGIVVDVGANVGMATFAATAAMGFHVVAFEPVLENLQRLCDGLFLNRAWDRVSLFAAAASDRIGNITFHKVFFAFKKKRFFFGNLRVFET
ncbi:uncharacterized protein LOC120267749 [Dioscorea cayenensis subsp. rotundata]|uniref:Uncharacterized protein LOC120267749 n=1 Tax=Dioscorea cayennensis subsp. rotundata TaxID=55577 RepID=A0AB40BV61_DIOCR|nr:uncharacterized protein LOC120267749 [Dioscorea cayenensis subsp. rotundata]